MAHELQASVSLMFAPHFNVFCDLSLTDLRNIESICFKQLSGSIIRTIIRSLGGTPYNGLYGEAPPERGILFSLQVYESVGISLVEVDKRVRKSVIWVC